MNSVCFYFQVHQPYRIRKDYNFFNIGKDHLYFDNQLNKDIIERVSKKCYLPTTKILLETIQKYKGDFKVAFSLSGTVLEQLASYQPEVIKLFKELVDTGCVELLNETYYHSLAYFYSASEFKKQIKLHKEIIESLFNYKATTFRNTELIYDNSLAATIEKMGYKTILTEGANRILGWRSPNYVYMPKTCKKMKLLLKNFKLSDDIAFRFSRDSKSLTVEEYAKWIHQTAGNGETVNLFMDYETFGEHQWADTGILEFLKNLPKAILKKDNFTFNTPSEISERYQSMAKIDVPHPISWADVERDLTAWMGNSMQDSSLNYLYSIEKDLLKTLKKEKNPELLKTWRYLQTSDHFYYMCTKQFSDGQVHQYFNPFESPEDSYIHFSNVLNDYVERLKSTLKKNESRKTKKS